MIVSTAIQKMIEFYKGNRHDVNHFLKVWAMERPSESWRGWTDTRRRCWSLPR